MDVFIDGLVFQLGQADEGVERVGHKAIAGTLFAAANGLGDISREGVKCCWARGPSRRSSRWMRSHQKGAEDVFHSDSLEWWEGDGI